MRRRAVQGLRKCILRLAGMRAARAGLVLLIALSLATAACTPGSAPSGTTVPAISSRAPGTKRNLNALRLPVPVTFDLTHVEPEHFAAALGNDPARIFEFVRDQIGYEVYSGVLRGARGALLALAGNSLDRAILLGTLLRHAGYQVRYAGGTLRDAETRELVTSMWVERRPPDLGAGTPPSSPDATGAAEVFARVERDYQTIRDQIRQKVKIAPSVPSLEALMEEARSHYWLQWKKDGDWIDLDPSFGDSTMGRIYAADPRVLEMLPEELFHRVTVRVRIEENGERAKARDVLTYTATAADLSGRDLVLVHVPENWRGPAESVEEALQSAIEMTGKIKPVVIAGEHLVVGEAFQQRLRTTGLGGIGAVLRGEGSRTEATLATAEWIEFALTAPGRQGETVVREIFDVIGKALRGSGQPLTPEQIRGLTEREQNIDLTLAVFDMVFTTGRVALEHLPKTSSDTGPDESGDVLALLRRTALSFSMMADGLLGRIGNPKRAVVLFYPDSPRIHVLEIYSGPTRARFALDLRRDQERAVVIGSPQRDVVGARVLRGVVNGTFERAVVEAATSSLREKGLLGPVMSTSLVFEKARDERVPITLIQEPDPPVTGIAADAFVRLREDLSQGALVVAPRRSVGIGGVPRFAWWKIQTASGDTIAVTDEGLHSAGSEGTKLVGIVKVKVVVGARTFVHYTVMSQEGTWLYRTGAIFSRSQAFERIRSMLSEGYRFVGRLPPSALDW